LSFVELGPSVVRGSFVVMTSYVVDVFSADVESMVFVPFVVVVTSVIVVVSAVVVSSVDIVPDVVSSVGVVPVVVVSSVDVVPVVVVSSVIVVSSVVNVVPSVVEGYGQSFSGSVAGQFNVRFPVADGR